MISHFFTRPRAEARLPRQPSTLAPSAHPRGAFLSYRNEVSYTIKKLLLETTLAFLAWFQQELFFTYLYFPLFFCAIPLRSADR